MNDSCGLPVFVVGSSRSGTTLLYSILLSSGEFPLYEAETHLLETCPVKYGNIKNEKNYKRFINDWIKSKPFCRSGLNPEEFKEDVEEHHNDYIDVLNCFMANVARKQGKKRWAEQTPAHLLHMENLSRAFPAAKFIHVIRDGRDVALSKRKVGWTGTRSKDPIKQLICAAISWKMAIKYGQIYGKKLGNNYLEVRYEDIICNLDEVLKKIGDFAKIKIDREKIRNSSIGSLRKANTAFINENMNGISSSGMGRWKGALTEKEISILNLVIGDTLFHLGYKLDNFENIQGSNLLWEIKIYSIIYPIFFNVKRFLKHKTLLGRFTSRSLVIGQNR